MSCLPSMPKRAWRIWTTPRATSCAEKELPRCSRRSRPQLPQHVLHHCPLALWAKPRTTRWRFGPNSRSSWNTRNSNSATISPKTPCAPLRSVAKTGSTSAANKPDPKSPPSSPSSKPADVGTSPCANTWRRSSPVSPKLPSITYPNSPPSPGPHKTADLHPRVNHGQPWFAPTRTFERQRDFNPPEQRAAQRALRICPNFFEYSNVLAMVASLLRIDGVIYGTSGGIGGKYRPSPESSIAIAVTAHPLFPKKQFLPRAPDW